MQENLQKNKIIQLREKYDLVMKVERYVSDSSQDGEKDEQFIRKESRH